VAEVSSSLNHCRKWTIPELNFITLQGILTHTLGNFPFRQPFPSYFGTWISATTSNCRTMHTSNVQDVHLQSDCMTVLPSAMQNVLPHVSACEHKPKFEWWGICPLAGPIRYLAYRVPYLRYVASTFKRLITTTTHCGVIKLINADGVPFQAMMLHITPSVILIVIAEK
jgi:hypothetical protein